MQARPTLLRLAALFPLLVAAAAGQAQTTIRLDYVEPGPDKAPITYALETTVWEPERSNGRVVVFAHGAVGKIPGAQRQTYRLPRLAQALNERGYTLVIPMRKGRGQSQGSYTEESGSCASERLERETREADAATDQIVDQVRRRYAVDQVILIGHSRGGFLAATYATRHPDKVAAVVNLSGTWGAVCEAATGFGRAGLRRAIAFTRQFWVYATHDSYFAATGFNDENYAFLQGLAETGHLQFKIVDGSRDDDGHLTPLRRPETWLPDVLDWLDGHARQAALSRGTLTAK